MKDDVPVPEEVPRKRRQLHDAPDYWLAVWASRELSRADRERVDDERKRRKQLRGESDVVLGICIGREGITPEQFDYIAGYMTGGQPRAIVHAGAPPKLVRLFQVRHDRLADFAEVIKAATIVVAAVKEPAEPIHKSGVWGAVKYARHRRVPVRIVLPNGMEG